MTACLMVSLLLMARPMFGRMPCGFEQLLHQAARSRPRLAGEKGFAREVARREAGFRARRWGGRRNDDMGMIADQVDVHVNVVRRAAHDREVEIIAA